MSETETRAEALAHLDVLVGEWSVTAPGVDGAVGRSVVEWALGRAYLLQRTEAPLPEAPDSLAIVDVADGGGYTQHYFDSRGVTRIYRMTFDGRTWQLVRDAADFSALPFHQRFTATVSADGDTIDGAWERSADGVSWETDFALLHHRTA